MVAPAYTGRDQIPWPEHLGHKEEGGFPVSALLLTTHYDLLAWAVIPSLASKAATADRDISLQRPPHRCVTDSTACAGARDPQIHTLQVSKKKSCLQLQCLWLDFQNEAIGTTLPGAWEGDVGLMPAVLIQE